MREIFCKNIKWNDRANDMMGLQTMIDSSLVDSKNWEIPAIRYKPCQLLKPTDVFCLSVIYNDHKELLLELVDVFFPSGVFVPSEINKIGTDEYFLFKSISAVFDIVWFNNIEKSRKRGYVNFMKDVENAIFTLTTIGDWRAIESTLQYPPHQNETIEKLVTLFVKNKRSRQGEKVIKLIKEHFKIIKVTATKSKKIVNGNKKFLEILKGHGLTDDELKKIPVFGQLPTKI